MRRDGTNCSSRRFALLLIVASLGLSSCFLQLPEPSVSVTVSPYYNTADTLIPYEFQGEGSTSYGRYTLLEWAPEDDDYRLRESRDIQLPTGSSGVLSFDLPDNRYRLSFSVLSSRDGRFAPVPFLTIERGFVVDTRGPEQGLWVDPDPGSGPFPTMTDLPVTINSDGRPSITEAPVAFYYEIYSDAPGPDPTAASNQLTPGQTIHLYRDTPGSLYLRVLAIDEAGNSGGVWDFSYEFL